MRHDRIQETYCSTSMDNVGIVDIFDGLEDCADKICGITTGNILPVLKRET